MEAHDSQLYCQVDFFMPAGSHQRFAFHWPLCRALHSSLLPILVAHKVQRCQINLIPDIIVYLAFSFCRVHQTQKCIYLNRLWISHFEWQSPSAIAPSAHYLTSITAVNKCSASAHLWCIPCGLKCNNFSSNSILLSHSSPLTSLHCNIVHSQRRTETE